MPYFHDFNPFASELAYISVEDLISVLDKRHKRERAANRIYSLPKADTYVLANGDLGVRFGKERNDYLYYFSEEDKAKALWAKYSGREPK